MEDSKIPLTINDGCLMWPTANGGIIRIDPFHITAFGVAPGTMQDKTPVWVTWVTVSGGGSVGELGDFNTAHSKKEDALADFRRIQLVKAKH